MGDPKEVLNIPYVMGMIFLFTAFFLLIIKLNKTWVLRIIFFFVVAMTLFYGLSVILPALIALALAALLTVFLYIYPEWWMIDTIGLPIAVFAAWLFGINIWVLWILVLLAILAAYDFISVYKTGHMVTLAEGVMDLKIPILFVIPRKGGYSFREEKEFGQDAYYMGLGDAIIPTMLVVSANLPSVHGNEFLSAAPRIGFISYPALGALIGTLISFAVLSLIIGKGKPHAGLPFLNTGAIGGYLIGCAVSGVGFI
jgi:presenilin-like A22 family membrane protease